MNNGRVVSRRAAALLTALLAIAVAALGATSASAAKWAQGESPGLKLTGSVTVKVGAASTTCSWVEGSNLGEAYNSSGSAIAHILNLQASKTNLICPNGGLKFPFEFAEYFYFEEEIAAGEYQVTMDETRREHLAVPLGTTWYDNWATAEGDVKFVNGSALTPSKFVFNKAIVGWQGGYGNKAVEISGSVQAKTSSGGLLTLQ